MPLELREALSSSSASEEEAATDFLAEESGDSTATFVVVGNQAHLDEHVRAEEKDLDGSIDAAIASTKAWREAQAAKLAAQMEAMRAEAAAAVEPLPTVAVVEDEAALPRCKPRPVNRPAAAAAPARVPRGRPVNDENAIAGENAFFGDAPPRPRAPDVPRHMLSLENLDDNVLLGDAPPAESLGKVDALGDARTAGLVEAELAMAHAHLDLIQYSSGLDEILKALDRAGSSVRQGQR